MSEAYSSLGTLIGAFIGALTVILIIMKKKSAGQGIKTGQIITGFILSLIIASAISALTDKGGFQKIASLLKQKPNTPYSKLKEYFDLENEKAKSEYIMQVKQNFTKSAPGIKDVAVNQELNLEDLGENRLKVAVSLSGKVPTANGSTIPFYGYVRAYFTQKGIAHLEGSCIEVEEACKKLVTLIEQSEKSLIPLLNTDTNEGILPTAPECKNETLALAPGAPQIKLCSYQEGYTLGFYRSSGAELNMIKY
jgi:hypothetical protein